MTDAELRELQRTDRLAWLKARVRLGSSLTVECVDHQEPRQASFEMGGTLYVSPETFSRLQELVPEVGPQSAARELGLGPVPFGGLKVEVSKHLSNPLPCPNCGTGSGRVPWPWRGEAGRLALLALCSDRDAATLAGAGDPGPLDSSYPPHWDPPCAAKKQGGAWCWVSLETWLRGLERFPREALIRAAVAAAWVALSIWEKTPEESDGGGGSLIEMTTKIEGRPWHEGFERGGVNLAPRRALEAAEAWLACPCEEHQSAWRRSFLGVLELAGEWLPAPDSPTAYRSDCLHAARIAGEQPVRDRIQKELIAWALQ